MKLYIVTVKTAAYPAEDMEIYAKNASDAMKQARETIRRAGHTRMDGPINCVARVTA